MKHLYVSLPCLSLLLASPTWGQAPTVTSRQPAANALAVRPSAPVVITFSQPLTPASGAALRVFSSQQGGLRTAGAGSPAVVSGNTLSFAPQAAAYHAGETVRYTLTTAVAGSGGALARPVVGQFTVAAQGTGTSLFGTGVTTADGITPIAVAAADIDADGDLDLLTANTNSNDVSVLRNNGRGTFDPSQRVAAEHPNSLSVGDLDGDGDLDFVTSVEYVTQAVSVRLNNGTGTFSPAANVVTDFTPGDTALADLDGDGDLDLLVVQSVSASINTSRVSVFLNNGRGTFSAGGSFAAGYVPKKLAVGDLDDDGDLDCVVANYGSTTGGYSSNLVTVALNAGNATFTLAPAVSVGISPLDVALGDLDGDGDLDMAVANSNYATYSSVSFSLNTGNGTFSTNSAQTLALPSTTNAVTLGDLDGDGDLDVAAAITGYFTGAGSFFERTVYTARNAGNGSFVAGQAVYVGQAPFALRLADLDGDQDLDLATANLSSNYSVSLNQSVLPTRASQSALPFALAPNPTQSATTVRGVAPHASVRVLDALGRAVLQATADAAGTAQLVWPTPPTSGVYIVQAGQQSQRLVVLE
jgi:hypothetical protein